MRVMSDYNLTCLHYVIGFALTPNWDRVLLAQRFGLEWGTGKYNGVGGQIRHDESPVEGMVRKFREKTNLMSLITEWRLFCTLKGIDRYGGTYKVWFFVSDSIHTLDTVNNGIYNEYLNLIPVDKIKDYSIINALTWLLPMAMADSPVLAEVTEQL